MNQSETFKRKVRKFRASQDKSQTSLLNVPEYDAQMIELNEKVRSGKFGLLGKGGDDDGV